MTTESSIEKAINEAMAILTGLEVLREMDEPAPSVLETVKESANRLLSLLQELSQSS